MAHYYAQTETGVEPRHYVPMASRPEELRPTRITDVRKWWKQGELVVPSVTTIQNVLAKDALVNWKIDQHLSVAYEIATQEIPDYVQKALKDFDGYKAEVKYRAEQEMDKAPSAGTDFHQLMEDYVEGKAVPKELSGLCLNVANVIDEATKGTGESVFKTEHNFVSKTGYGGQIDLIVEDVNSDWIIDYKTKQTADKFKPGKMAYTDHAMQLAAYREAVNPKARCANVFVCLEDGQIDFHEHKEEDLQKGWQIFQHALGIWQINNGWEQCSQSN